MSHVVNSALYDTLREDIEAAGLYPEDFAGMSIEDAREVLKWGCPVCQIGYGDEEALHWWKKGKPMCKYGVAKEYGGDHAPTGDFSGACGTNDR